MFFLALSAWAQPACEPACDEVRALVALQVDFARAFDRARSQARSPDLPASVEAKIQAAAAAHPELDAGDLEAMVREVMAPSGPMAQLDAAEQAVGGLQPAATATPLSEVGARAAAWVDVPTFHALDALVGRAMFTVDPRGAAPRRDPAQIAAQPWDCASPTIRAGATLASLAEVARDGLGAPETRGELAERVATLRRQVTEQQALDLEIACDAQRLEQLWTKNPEGWRLVHQAAPLDPTWRDDVAEVEALTAPR